MSEQEFEKAFSDEEFVKTLLGLETGEQVRSTLAEKGIVLTPEELDKFAEVLLLALEKKEKLPDDDLTGVSGGRAVVIQEGAVLFALRVRYLYEKTGDEVVVGVPQWAQRLHEKIHCLENEQKQPNCPEKTMQTDV